MSPKRFTLSFVFVSVAVAVSSLVLSLFSFVLYAEDELITDAAAERIRIVIDAGHGAEDGGAVSADGAVFEKDLNLSVAACLYDMLCAAGFDVVMTRTDDSLLCTEEERATGHRKQGDLRGRLAYMPRDESGIFVSIHMNSFPEEYVHGAQIYYSANHAGSADLASKIKDGLTDAIGKESVRHSKAADSSIFLLDRAECTAVLIECGFISNSEECKKLCREDYQKELCFSIFCAIMEYINDTEAMR